MSYEILSYEEVLAKCLDYDASLGVKGRSNRQFTVDVMAKEIFESQFPKHIAVKSLSKSTIRAWKIALDMTHTIKRIHDKSAGVQFNNLNNSSATRSEIARRIATFKETKMKDNHQKYSTAELVANITLALEGVRPDMPQGTLCYWMNRIGISTHGMSKVYRRNVLSRDAKETPQDVKTLRLIHSIFTPPTARRYVGY